MSLASVIILADTKEIAGFTVPLSPAIVISIQPIDESYRVCVREVVESEVLYS